MSEAMVISDSRVFESEYFGPIGNAEILNVTEQEYHADPCETPSLSSTIARILVDESPEKAWATHPKLGGQKPADDDEHEGDTEDPKKRSDPLDNGKVVHRLLLGKGSDFVQVDARDWRTNAAKDARKEAESVGKVAILKTRLGRLEEAAGRIAARLASEFGIRLTGRSELVVTWRERVFASDATVLCRAMLDHVYIEDGLIIDLKTAYSANPEACAKAINEHGYHVQRAAYCSALRAMLPHIAGREDYINVFAELKPPYAVNPMRMSGAFQVIGETLWRRGVTLWHECMQSGRWPGYARGQIGVALPLPWMISKALNAGIEVGEDL